MRRFVWLLLLGACADPVEVECRLNSDCPANELCDDGACVPECREDRDCPTPQICQQSLCIDPGPSTRLCARVTDCGPAQTCVNGLCAAVSVQVRDGGPSMAPRDGGVSPVDGGSPMGLPYGAACARGSECASTYCVGDAASMSGRCTIPCTQDLDCTRPDTCEEVPGAGFFCASVNAGLPTGAICPNGAPDCAGGICIARPSADPFCSERCSPLPACPPNFVCQPLPDGMGGAEPVCIPGTGGGFGSSCTRAADCQTSLCVGVAGSATGVCTTFCDQIPCPTGYTCAAVDDGAGGVVQICAPAGSVGGQFGDACAGASGCANGLCLHDARTGGAFCTIPCASPADCAPVPGLTCVRLADGSAVCGPP
ncbi:MAG: hypothetical protein RIT81_20240 [Deltaproteobacteria bacterium]